MAIKSKQFNSIDLTKLLMAIFVVAIHTNPLAGCKHPIVISLFNCIFQCAVPFFFISSGFLLIQKADNTAHLLSAQSAVLKHLKKIIKMYVLWSVIYMPLAIYNLIISAYPPIKSIVIYLRGLLVVGENYNSWMLWYLLSTIYSLIFVAFLMKLRIKLTHITLLGGAVFLLGSVITEFVGYNGNLSPFLLGCQKILSVTIVDGRIFTGFLYIPLGMLLAKKQISFSLGVPLTLFGFICNVFFDGVIGDVMLAVCSVGIFAIVSNIELKESSFYPVARRASTAVYFVHMYVWTIYYSLVYHEKTFGLDSFVATTVISLIIASALIFVKKASKAVPEYIAQAK